MNGKTIATLCIFLALQECYVLSAQRPSKSNCFICFSITKDLKDFIF